MELLVREAFYVGPTSRVFSATNPETGASLALKLPLEDEPSERRLDKLRHEHALLRRVQGPGVIRELGLSPHGSSLALVLERWGESSLDAVLSRGPLPWEKALRLGAKLARALGQVHRHAVIHRDVKPHNVLVDAALEDVRLIDFGIAVQHNMYVSQNAAPDALAGTPAYMAPEQTGRMNRGVDTRADLYSLGVTVHQMLTGALPFEIEDLAELIHAHIARRPAPPHERAPSLRIPPVVSAIVLKLLAKNPDDRYQTAEGAAFDLERAADPCAEGGGALDFELGARDWEDRIRKPSRLFGRERESALLEEALARIAAGAVEMALVAGPSGVGKSALVQALRESVAPRHAIFAPGKFDRLQRGTPHLALSQAFRSIVRRRLADSAEDLSRWKTIWQEAAGPNGRILVDSIPELVHILGEPPPMADVGPIEAQNRFVYTLRRFVQVTASEDHPLVLFIDDLQWADAATTTLLQEIVNDPEVTHLFVIGTYRDDEVDSDHPLHALRAAVEARRRVPWIPLSPLGLPAVEAVVSDMLQRPLPEIRALAAVTKTKTDGSPFFVEQFLRALHEQGLLRRDRESGAWQFDLGQIDRAGATENVVSLLARRTRRLSAMAQRALFVGACAGTTFESRLLTAVVLGGEDARRDALEEILQEGLVQPAVDVEHEAFEFAHDRVQQAAYEAQGEDERAAVHHALAWAIEKTHGPAMKDAELFAMLHHHLRSLPLLDGEEARIRVAEAFLRGGRRARAESTYAEALKFLRAGQELLGPAGWQDHPALAFDLHLALAEASWLSGQSESGEQAFRECFERAADGVARTRVATLWFSLLTGSGRFAEATTIGVARAREIGYAFPDDAEEIQQFFMGQLERIVPRLKGASLEALASSKRCTNAAAELEALLLARLGLAVGLGKTELLPSVALATTEHAFIHGVSRATAVGCGVSAMMTVGVLQDYELASRLVHLGQSYLHDAFGMSAYAMHGLSIAKQYIAPLHAVSKEWRLGAEMGRNEGDMPFGAYCSYMSYLADLLSGHAPLGAPPKQIAPGDFTAGQFEAVLSALHAALTGGAAPRALEAAEAWCETTPPVPFFIQGARACASFLALHLGATRTALEHALAGLPHWPASVSHPHAIATVFALCLGAQRYPDECAHVKSEIDAFRARLERWAAFTPQNFRHMKLLVDACEAWREARHGATAELFQAAIVDAHENGFTNDEALGSRLLGEYHLERGHVPLARAHLRDASSAYLRWGAPTCANAIRKAYPQFFPEGAMTVAAGSTTPTISRGTVGGNETVEGTLDMRLDGAALLRATQALSGDMVLGSLVGRVLRLLATNAGAERGVLALVRGSELFVEAEIGMDPERLSLELHEPADRSNRVPMKIVKYVERSKEPLLLGQAITDNRFDEDPYLLAHRPASILAVPLVHQGRLVGVMYLEHSQIVDAFPKARVELTSLLAAQAATAVENATLYSEVEKKTIALQAWSERLERQVEERTTELRAAKEAADRANHAKSAFLSSMSHELRTPLNGILGYAQILERAPDLSESARDGAAIIKKSGDHLLRLINDVLDLAKIEAGKMDLVPRDVGLASLMNNVASLCRVRAEQKGIAFELDVPAEAALVVRADEKRLMQVLLNLAGNAIKFTKEGGVKVGVEVRPGTDATAELRFRVRDTGPGIAEQHLARIFEPFEQVGDGNEKAEGTGLGLSITKTIVERMGGHIEVQSEVGRGSTFTVTLELPVNAGASAAGEEIVGDEIAGYLGERRRILVVDDNPNNRKLLDDFLSPLGFEVIAAENGERALVMAIEHRPALILMDMMMPGMDGAEAIRRLRAMPELGRTAIIASSASISAEREQRSAAAGADDFLPKPVELRALLDKMERLLGLSWIRRQRRESRRPSMIPPGTPMASLHRPPSEDLAPLRSLAEQGRLHAILAELDRLEQVHPQCSHWLAQVRALAMSFQIKPLRELLDIKSPASAQR